MADPAAWIDATRASHDHFTSIVQPLSESEVEQPAYPKDWSIADTASHLGSQAEIFELSLAAGLAGRPSPGPEQFGPIWDRWNALAPLAQVRGSVAANEALVTQIESTSLEQRDHFSLSLFGMDVDFAGLLSLRLGEHALHTWDIAVARQPTATIPASASGLLVDQLGSIVARAGQPAPGMPAVHIHTTGSDRHFLLTVDPAVTLASESGNDDAAELLTMPTEALIRLVYGRLDPDHTPPTLTDPRLPALRRIFPGF